jgi:hypothetical protein
MKQPLYSSSLRVRLDPPHRSTIEKLAAEEAMRTIEFVRRELRRLVRSRKLSERPYHRQEAS